MCAECECTSTVLQTRDHSMRKVFFSKIACFNITDACKTSYNPFTLLYLILNTAVVVMVRMKRGKYLRK